MAQPSVGYYEAVEGLRKALIFLEQQQPNTTREQKIHELNRLIESMAEFQPQLK